VLFGTGTGAFDAPITFAVGNIPDALVVGDFNGDGKADFAVTNFGDDTVSVLLNQGDGGFSAQPTYPVGMHPWAIAAGDFNGDGLLDLAVENAGDDTVSVLSNMGAGAFGTQVAYAVGACPQGLAVRDFTGNGKLDIAVANSCDGTVGLLLNEGDGGFAYQQPVVQAGSQASALAAADFNGDGLPDLAVTLDFTGAGSPNVALLLNQGKGVFALDKIFQAGDGPGGVVAGDFNGDGHPDVAVSNFYDDTVSVLLNEGNGRGRGGLEPQVTYAAGPGPVFIAVGDFNEDGRPDLAFADTFGGVWWNGNSVNVVLNLGRGTFAAPTSLTVGVMPESIALADFNADGHLDLAVANFGGFSTGAVGTVSVLLGTGNGDFGAATTLAVGNGPNSVVAADFNGDGHPDLAAANQGDDDVSVLLGDGDGGFGPQTTFPAGGGSTTVAVGDFNGDGHPDLAVANFMQSDGGPGKTVSIMLGDGAGGFGAPIAFPVSNSPWTVAVGDFNEDGRPDLAVGYYSGGNKVDVLLATGPTTFGPPQHLTVGPNPVSIAVADFNGDGHLDLAVANRNSGNDGTGLPGFASVLLGDGTGSFGGQILFTTLSEPYAVAVGDFDGDGLPDVAVSDYEAGGGDQVSIFLNNCQ
jgi:hypothetical protein